METQNTTAPISPDLVDDGAECGSYLPYDENPTASLDKQLEKPGVPAAERIAALYDRMGSARAVLDGLVAFCREPRTSAEVEEEAVRLLGKGFSIYSPSTYMRLLKQAGALEETGAEELEPQVVEVNGVKYLEPAAAAAPAPAEGEPAEGQAAEPRLVATPEGIAMLEEHGSLGAFERVLEEDARYEHVYRVLLDCCANEGGATAKQMGDAVDDDPELQEPRMYASYFFNRLAECGLLAWNEAWHITDLGRQAAEMLDARA